MGANESHPVGWRTEAPWVGSYVCPLSFEDSLIHAWLQAGFDHYVNGYQGAPARQIDFVLYHFYDDRRPNNPLVVIPTNEGARLWLQMNAPA